MVLTSGIKRIIESSFTSVFKGIMEKIETEKDFQKLMADSSEEYSEWVIRNFGYIDLFLKSNEQVKVNKLHVSLSFSNEIKHETHRRENEIVKEIKLNDQGADQRHRKNQNLDIMEVINGKRKSGLSHREDVNKDIAILGVAGSGKTTSMKYLMYRAAAGDSIRGSRRLPFFISLRGISIEKGFIEKFITESLHSWKFNYVELVARKLIESGSILLILDGLDEVESAKQTLILNELSKFRNKFFTPKNTNECHPVICITGRPYSLERQLTGFSKYVVQDLEDKDSRDLVENWFGDKNKEKASRLLKVLDENTRLNSFRTKPFMLSIICALFDKDYRIPNGEHEVIKECLCSGTLILVTNLEVLKSPHRSKGESWEKEQEPLSVQNFDKKLSISSLSKTTVFAKPPSQWVSVSRRWTNGFANRERLVRLVPQLAPSSSV